MYLRELFKEVVAISDINGLYQLKKLLSLGSVYIFPWIACNNPVALLSSLKKDFKLGGL